MTASHSEIEVVDNTGKAEPLTVICFAESSEAGRAENVRINIKRDVHRLLDLPGILRQRNEPIAIVGGGPSLKSQLDKLRTFKQVMVCGSAHDYLIDNGIIPTFAMSVEPKINQIEFYRRKHKDTSYILASQCSPEMFDHLEGHKIAMWHFKGQVDDINFNGERPINWGCMVTVLGIQIALFLGFQHLHFFGLDCSLTEEEAYSYNIDSDELADMRRVQQEVKIGDKKTPFITTMSLIAQAQHFFEIFKSEDGDYLKGTVYGNGMLAEMIRQAPPEMSEWLEVA